MAKSVYVERAGEILDFPDTATPQQIQTYIDRKYGAPVAPVAPLPAETGPDESGTLGRAAYGFATGLTDIPGGIAALMYPSEEAIKTSAGQFSEEARKYLQETFGIDPRKDPTAAQQAAQALGSVGSFLVPGAGVAKGASLLGRGAAAAARAGTATAAAQGVALGASGRSQKIQQQLAEGMQISPEEQLAAQRLDGLIGVAEAAPINRFFGPLTTLLSKVPVSKAPIVERIIQSRLANIAKAGAAEGAQEAASGIANDLVEYGVYNPDVEIGQDLLSNAGTGAFAGSFVEGIIQLAAGRKLRPYKQLSEDLAKEQATNSIAVRQGQIALGAEDLRNFNVEGDVEIAEEEIDGLPRFTIKTGAGNSVGQFLDPSEAEEAVEIYKQRTGAKVTVRKPEDLPSVFPVKIGGEEFNSTDEIIAARDGLVSKSEGLASYMSRPEILKREATRQNVSEALVKKAVDAEVADLNGKISKLNDFIATAKPTPAEVAPESAPIIPAQEAIAPMEEVISSEEAVAEQQEPLAEPEAVTAIEEEPIGAVTPEIPVEEARYIEEAPAVSGPTEIEPPTRKEMRPSATDEQLTALKIELFGEPKGYRDMTPEELSVYEAERDKRYPPMEVDLYSAGPVKEARPVRRTLAQAEAEGPIVRDYTPETQQRYQDIYTALKSRLSGRVPKDVDVKLEELIKADKNVLIRGQARAEKTPNGIKSIVDLSTGVLRPDMTVEQAVKELAETLDHEIIHVLRDQGVLRPAEWNILSKAATNTKVPGKAYTYLDKAQAVYTPAGQPIAPIYANPDAVVEEAVAEMYKDWVKNQTAPVQTRGLFNRITEFFRSIFRVLKSSNHEAIFKGIESGEVGSREAVPIEVVEQQQEQTIKLSAAPLPPYVEAKNRTLFRPEPKEPFHKQMFDFFLGHPTAPKTIRTIHGDIELSAKDRFLLSARVGAVDNTAYVEHLEKLLNERDTGSFQRRDADFSATAALAWNRRSSQLAASVIMMGKPEIKFARPGDIQSATIAAENDPDSLLNIFRTMLEPGPIDSVTGEAKDKREVFRSYATAMRAIGLKAAGKPVPRELDDTYVNTTIAFTQQNYPEVVEAYRMYQRFNKNLLTAARDAGVITSAELANLTRKMDYYGFYREVYQEELTPNIPSKTAGKFDLREYKGSQYGNLIDDPMFVIVQNTQFWMSAISRNLAATKTFELAKNMGEARLLGASEKPDPARGESSDVMFFRKDGVTKRFAVSDPLLVSALGSDDRADIGAAMKVLGYPTQIIRESVTRDPAFMITNLIRDTLSSWITSGEDFTPFIGTAKGFAKALKGTASYEALMGRGVVGSHDLAMQGPGELAATLRRRLNPPNVHSITSVKGATDVLGTLWDRLGVWSEASDAATRIAVYESAKAQGMSEAEATFRAIQILDFSRRGGSLVLNMLTKLIPFLNARIQGLDVLYQAGMAGQRYLRGQSRGEKDANLGKKFLVRGTILAAISLALEMMNEDDEDYKDLPDYLKKSNLLIPLKGFGLDGQFLAIAKPFEAGLIFSTMPQQFYKTMAGDVSTRDNVGFFVESFASTLGVNPIPQILMPALEVIVNHDFYTGLPLISEGKARLSPELQYDSRTSTLARMLGDIPISYNFTTGKFEGVSPIIIDQLIGGYGGPIGTMIAQGVGYGLEMAEQGPERLPRDLTAHPIIRRFFVDAESRSPKTVAQAYELFRIVDEANRSFSRLRQTGDAEAAMRYLEENKDALTYKKYVFKLVDRLNKLSAYERQIERDKEMTDDEKREAVNKIREVRKNLTSKIGEINKALGR